MPREASTDERAPSGFHGRSEQRRFTFTVFTPAYDRASTLPRVKASLEAQTFRDFEWLIVDDGSTDGTADLVAGWIESSPLMIRYIRQENAGKHVAINRGAREARGDFFLTIDSDDECVPQALGRLLHHWNSIPSEDRAAFSGVSVLAVYGDGGLVGEPFPSDVYDSDPLRKYFASVGRGDKWGFHRTDVLLRFPFPEPPGVKHVAMSVAWFAIGRHYKTRYVNEPLLIVHSDGSGERLHHFTSRTAPGRRIFHQEVVTRYIDFMASSPALVVKSGINYCRYSFHGRIWPLEQVASVKPNASRLLVMACLLPGAVAFARDIVISNSQRRA
jgi:glycosyltransferase involved in cell wall biosynthesis